ncbi:MAG TPA: ATP-dependent DNA helicase RecG, partial [Candidatus Saccharimonadales bacterium]|nr:ATP-dependent DNA helicase RecG [Candidatus Saccharimonadales bacterium]
MSELGLGTPVTELKGVGAALGEKLHRLGIEDARDLLLHFPFRWEDYSQIAKISAMKPGLVSIGGKIEQVAARWARTRKLHILEAVISDDSGSIKAIWFNQPYLKAKLVPGTPVVLSGKLEFRNNDFALQAPTIEFTSELAQAKIVPIYPETQGITSRQLTQLIGQILPLVNQLSDDLPPSIREDYKLIDFKVAIQTLHQPESTKQLISARHRLAFEELFFIMACGLIIKSEMAAEPAQSIAFDQALAQSFVQKLGFKLTDAQRLAAWAVLKDLAKDSPMHRLLEGDVGSGKTVVAALAALMASANGYQTAIMVPTEVLANQHAKNLAPLFDHFGYRLALVAGRQTTSLRRELQTKLADGSINIVVGTQALLTNELKFQRLGLVVIDEQHRFGVEQRQLLKQKAGYLPHLLTMTATPIPRTLALAVYGDLDISIINELPPGRIPVQTKVISEGQRQSVYAQVETEITQGRQVYVVCPLINDSDVLGAKSVLAEAQRLRQGPLGHRRITVIHGRMKSEAKNQIMADFASGQIDILVATSLIEVGLDVPNASVIIIEAAERYGLATLH